MAESDVVKAISHYQRDIEKICSRPERILKYEERLLHCLTKLHKLPVTVNHLQVTGVGKTVNSLRKAQSNKGLNDAAKALVAKWKAMVIEEDEQAEVEAAPKKPKLYENSEPDYVPSPTGNGDEMDYEPVPDMNSYSPQSTSQKSEGSYTPSKKSSKPNGYSPSSSKSSGIAVYCYSPSVKVEKNREDSEYSPSKSSNRDDGESDRSSVGKTSHSTEKSSKHKSRHRSSEEKPSKDSKKHSSSSSKSHKSSSHHSSSSKSKKSESSPATSNGDKTSSHSKHKSSSSKSSSSKHATSSSSKSSKVEVKTERISPDTDVQAGSSFADALGPMLVKKSSSSPKKKHRSDDGDAKSSSSKASSSKKRDESPSKFISKKSAGELLDEVAGPSHLPPLNLDLLNTLSTPNPNYRPLPQVPLTAMDRKIRIQAEEDALAKIISNKKIRTKVFSGNSGGLLYVPSLYECCCRVLQQHIDLLEYTGGIPYDLLKPVLENATPDQLLQFEHYNPYIIEDTDELWKFHVSKYFRGAVREEMESYREMYLRCQDEREQKFNNIALSVKGNVDKDKNSQRQTKLAYVDFVKPPREVRRLQMKNGTGKPDTARLMGKDNPDAVPVRAPGPSPRVGVPTRDFAHFKLKPRVAPLMQKTLKSIKNIRFKR